jgi:PDZ domain-containing protein
MLVQAREPGDPLRVTIVRDGTTQTVEVTAGRVVPAVAAGRAGASGAGGSPDGGSGPECVAASVGTGAACLGIVVQTFTRFEFPIDVNFDIARVGGPSAGLAFALAIIDDLTPGDLTGGERVAVTGAITGDGVVQVVGGVEQKAITAREDGVDLMLVPRSEVAAARRGAGSLRVVGVDTIDDALSALQEAGGSPVPPPAPTSARS